MSGATVADARLFLRKAPELGLCAIEQGIDPPVTIRLEDEKRKAAPTLDSHRRDITAAMAFLNEKTGKTFRWAHPNGSLTHGGELLRALYKHGYALADVRIVVARKCRDWGGDAKMRQYLRPNTLFRLSNFETYRGESDADVS